jgi:hypothetical protein
MPIHTLLYVRRLLDSKALYHQLQCYPHPVMRPMQGIDNWGEESTKGLRLTFLWYTKSLCYLIKFPTFHLGLLVIIYNNICYSKCIYTVSALLSVGMKEQLNYASKSCKNTILLIQVKGRIYPFIFLIALSTIYHYSQNMLKISCLTSSVAVEDEIVGVLSSHHACGFPFKNSKFPNG